VIPAGGRLCTPKSRDKRSDVAKVGRKRRLSTTDARTQSKRRVVDVVVDVPVGVFAVVAVADEDHSGHSGHDLPQLSRG